MDSKPLAWKDFRNVPVATVIIGNFFAFAFAGLMARGQHDWALAAFVLFLLCAGGLTQWVYRNARQTETVEWSVGSYQHQ